MSEQIDQSNGTPSSKWRQSGEADPHGNTYACERADLVMGSYTDDELANAVFMHDHHSLDIEAILRGEPSSIALLTAAKDRIRWLSRSLDDALAREASLKPDAERHRFGRHLMLSEEFQEAMDPHMQWLNDSADPVTQEEHESLVDRTIQGAIDAGLWPLKAQDGAQ